jgi:recombination protein RecA
MTGNRTRVKVVKNKVAPPFKMTEFDIMYGKGISYAGDLLDLALQGGVVEKMGSWFSYKGDKIAQGREKVKTLFDTDNKLMKSVLSDVKDYLELG